MINMKTRKTWDNIITAMKSELEHMELLKEEAKHMGPYEKHYCQSKIYVWDFKGTISNFIKYLKENGLVFVERDGDYLYFETEDKRKDEF